MRPMFKCKECLDLLMDYLEGHLDPETMERLDQHFAACPPCLHFVESYRNCSDLAQQLKDQRVEIPAALEDRLKGFLRQEFAGPA